MFNFRIKPEDSYGGSDIFPYVQQLFHRSSKNLAKNKSTPSLNEDISPKKSPKNRNSNVKPRVDNGRTKIITKEKPNNPTKKPLLRNKSLDSAKFLSSNSYASNEHINKLSALNCRRKLTRKSSYSDSDGDHSGSSSNDSDLEYHNKMHGSAYFTNGIFGDRVSNALLPALPNLMKPTSSKNEFYPPNTTISNLNKSFSAR